MPCLPAYVALKLDDNSQDDGSECDPEGDAPLGNTVDATATFGVKWPSPTAVGAFPDSWPTIPLSPPSPIERFISFGAFLGERGIPAAVHKASPGVSTSSSQCAPLGKVTASTSSSTGGHSNLSAPMPATNLYDYQRPTVAHASFGSYNASSKPSFVQPAQTVSPGPYTRVPRQHDEDTTFCYSR